MRQSRGLALILLALCIPGAVAQAQDPGDALLVEAHELMTKGRYEQARQRLEGSSAPQARRLLIELAQRRGDRKTADSLAGGLLSDYRNGRLESALDLAQAAFAAWQLEDWHTANQIYLEAAALNPVPASLYIDWGRLYLQKYNPGEAIEIFQDARRATAEPSPPARWGAEMAFLGLAEALSALGQPGADEAIAKAEEINPESLDLKVRHALQAIRESDWETAETKLKEGLRQNKNHLPLLELKAAMHYFQGDDKLFEEARGRVLKINPSNASLFELLGDLAVRRRRMDDAIPFYRHALENDPRSWTALASLGMNLLRVGREEEGKRVLEEAYANDPFNLWTVNTLRLLDSFERFSRFETEHFFIKIRSDEASALRPYVEEMLEKSLTTMEKRYDHQIEGKYTFEIYPDHGDFAVRTLGMPGLGALGATFGRVVAMDSPSARPANQFHWGSTLWHEVAHVLTLAISDDRVPRWLTEGISVMEERLAEEGWGDFITPAFVKAYQDEKLLELKDLDSGFERPRFPGQLALSYFQAGWICDFLAERYGFEKIRAMLVAFGEETTTETVFKDVLGVSIEEVSAEFDEEMKKVLQPYVDRLERPRLASAEPDLDSILDGLAANPENYHLNMLAGARLASQKRRDEAVERLEKAIELFPYDAGESSPYTLLAEIHQEEGNAEEETRVRLEQWKLAPRIYANGYRLAELLRDQGRREESIRVLEGLMYVNPFRPEPHRLLGDLYLERDSMDLALREFQVLLDLEPPDMADAHYRLARALKGVGQSQTARRHVLLALEIAPSYREAQKLLLELVRQ